MRLARRAAWGALGLSLLIHAVGWFIAAFIVVGHGTAGQGGGEGAAVEMAVVTEAELSQLEAEALGVQTPTVPDAPLTEIEIADIQDAAPGDEPSSALEATGDIGPIGGGGDITGGGGEGLGGSGGGGASFFGVEAQGNRFAYLVDVSASMEGPRIATLRSELAKSIEALVETSSFLIVKFSTEAQAVGSKGWGEASPAVKNTAMTNISLLTPEAATIPLPGFKIIFGMRPRPDAIYFMTDGEFAPELVEEVAMMNRQFRVPIHCICFGNREGEANMKRIATGSRGTYTFVAGP